MHCNATQCKCRHCAGSLHYYVHHVEKLDAILWCCMPIRLLQWRWGFLVRHQPAPCIREAQPGAFDFREVIYSPCTDACACCKCNRVSVLWPRCRVVVADRDAVSAQSHVSNFLCFDARPVVARCVRWVRVRWESLASSSLAPLSHYL